MAWSEVDPPNPAYRVFFCWPGTTGVKEMKQAEGDYRRSQAILTANMLRWWGYDACLAGESVYIADRRPTRAM